jgi:hypothetical protein
MYIIPRRGIAATTRTIKGAAGRSNQQRFFMNPRNRWLMNSPYPAKMALKVKYS